MGEISRTRGIVNTGLAATIIAALAGCAQPPAKPASTHLGIEPQAPRPEGAVPAPVQVAPLVPPPTPAARPETYSVVVNNVRVQDLLFALARDAKLNVDIHPGVTGSVTINAIDQTLPQMLSRIAKQVDMRYEMDGQTLTVMRDTPYLRIYRVDYLNMIRDSKSEANLATQVSGTVTGGAGTGGGGVSATGNNSLSTVKSTSLNKFWESLVGNIRDLLRETDKIIPAASAAPAPAVPAPGAAPGAAAAIQPPQPATEFREAASVISNSETGVLSIRATSRQHEKVQEFLDNVRASSKRQVLIEATVVEVQLNNAFQRGIDWQRLIQGGAGLGFSQSPRAAQPQVNVGSFLISFATGGRLDITGTLKLLESFGDVRVLSSPKLSVLNNQTAQLKVVDNLVYFTVTANTVTAANSPAVTTFNTTVNSVPVGFIMSVTPQISENDTVLINVRPTISRRLGDVNDPNPALANPCGTANVTTGTSFTCNIAPIASPIPVIQTREMESIMRLQSGQTAVLGGLMQDSATNVHEAIPGLSQVPAWGSILSQRTAINLKTELVIFLRSTVIRDDSVDGDYANFRALMPREDFLQQPNPSKPPLLQ
ncbi:MAG: type II and III secretion system protein [Burkholderiales bacterium]|nr:type II and III secretion system protein [Burkholderiales bacterium]